MNYRILVKHSLHGWSIDWHHSRLTDPYDALEQAIKKPFGFATNEWHEHFKLVIDDVVVREILLS